MTGAAPRPVVVIDLLSLGRLHLQPGEVGPILRHRHLLTTYLVTLLVLVSVDLGWQVGQLPLELRGTVHILAGGTALALMWLALEAALWLAARRGTVRLPLTPLLMVAAAGSVAVADGLFHLLSATYDHSWQRLGLHLFFHYVAAEFLAAGLAHVAVPPILAELRGLPITRLAETDPALWAGEAEAPAPPLPGAEGFLVAGGRSFPLHQILHLRAEGNYVHLRASDRQELLPGPLADLVAQIPAAMGRQVHRSHWVAQRAITSWRAEGRDITLYLAQGQAVPVAVTRRREVRDWLRALDLPEGPAP